MQPHLTWFRISGTSLAFLLGFMALAIELPIIVYQKVQLSKETNKYLWVMSRLQLSEYNLKNLENENIVLLREREKRISKIQLATEIIESEHSWRNKYFALEQKYEHLGAEYTDLKSEYNDLKERNRE